MHEKEHNLSQDVALHPPPSLPRKLAPVLPTVLSAQGLLTDDLAQDVFEHVRHVDVFARTRLVVRRPSPGVGRQSDRYLSWDLAFLHEIDWSCKEEREREREKVAR